MSWQELGARLLWPSSKWAWRHVVLALILHFFKSLTRYASKLLENVGAALWRGRISSVPLPSLAQPPKGVNSVPVPFDQSGGKSRCQLST